jgi:ParB-like chromosome segregation protein Spo0J
MEGRQKMKAVVGKSNPADNVEKWAIERLTPYARNSRTHSDEQVAQLAASIREWGWTTPVLVDEDGGIIAGHGRVLAARQLGMVEVPVVVARGWSDAKRRAYVIADNKLAENAGWNSELLALELGELGELGFDLDLTGFDEGELSKITPDVSEIGLPELASGDRQPFQQMTFTLHDAQAEQVKRAIDAAKEMGAFDGPNENSNGNALARVCETFLTRHE